MEHLGKDPDILTNKLTGEDYLNSRREYWRKKAAKDRKNSEVKVNVAKNKTPTAKSSTNGLTGEAYLNSRREYWRKEIEKDPSSFRINTSQLKKKKTDDSNVFANIIAIVIGGIVFGVIGYIIISGGGPLLILFGAYAFFFILKHGR